MNGTGKQSKITEEYTGYISSTFEKPVINRVFIAEKIIVIESILVLTILLATVIFNLYFKYRKKEKKEIHDEIEKFIKVTISEKKTFEARLFPSSLNHPSIILSVFDFIDKIQTDENKEYWKDIKIKITQTVLLPHARVYANSNNWASRYYAVRIFEIERAPSDIKYIKTLIKDKVPLVRLNALHLALIFRPEDVIDDIITEISKERLLPRAIYMKDFNQGLQIVVSPVKKRLKSSNDPHIRATCYMILTRCIYVNIDWNVEADIRSNDINLKIAAIKFYVKMQAEKAMPILLEAIHDADWQVRTIVVQSLTSLDAKITMVHIAACLKDQNWWVRLSAAQALNTMGEEGQEILKSQSATDDRYAFDIAQYVLETI